MSIAQEEGELGEWLRTSRSRPCPICSKTSWCSVSADVQVAVCMRSEEGSVKALPSGGWLHRLADAPQTRESSDHRRRHEVRHRPTPDWSGLVRRRVAETTDKQLDKLAATLGLPDISPLRRLDVFWSPARRAFGFPMRRASGRVVGIRLRLRNGRKLSATGGREGCFIPSDLTGVGPLLICEGPSDTAAALALGFNAIGRPSCTGSIRDVAELAVGRDAVIVADADEPGRRGAEALVSTLVLRSPSVRIIEPPEPHGDLRAWLQAGATRDDVLQGIEDAPIRSLRAAALESVR